MESDLHRALKHAAAAHLGTLGCTHVATEVWCPLHRAVVDVAGARDNPRDQPPGTLFPGLWPDTFIVECKASRADLLVCARRQGPIRARRAALRERVRRAGLGAAPIPGDAEWAAVARALRVSERRLYAAAKFEVFARYRMATELWLAVPRGLIGADEVPAGWGVWEFDGARLSVLAAAPTRAAPAAPPAPTHFRGRLLGNILRKLEREARGGRAATPPSPPAPPLPPGPRVE